jgi:hypothetical protein
MRFEDIKTVVFQRLIMHGCGNLELPYELKRSVPEVEIMFFVGGLFFRAFLAHPASIKHSYHLCQLYPLTH